jgi:hypothetical protein
LKQGVQVLQHSLVKIMPPHFVVWSQQLTALLNNTQNEQYIQLKIEDLFKGVHLNNAKKAASNRCRFSKLYSQHSRSPVVLLHVNRRRTVVRTVCTCTNWNSLLAIHCLCTTHTHTTHVIHS